MEYPETHAHVMLMQMSVKAGIKICGKKGDDELMQELQQLHIRGNGAKKKRQPNVRRQAEGHKTPNVYKIKKGVLA